MKINDKEIQLCPEGYLQDPDDWNKDVAQALAENENLTLTDEHWQIFDSMREFYKENRVIPDVRHTTDSMLDLFGLAKKREAKAKLFKMFPYGYVKQACKIAGMRKPRGWSTG